VLRRHNPRAYVGLERNAPRTLVLTSMIEERCDQLHAPASLLSNVKFHKAFLYIFTESTHHLPISLSVCPTH
jgi:hypothetical protein